MGGPRPSCVVTSVSRAPRRRASRHTVGHANEAGPSSQGSLCDKYGSTGNSVSAPAAPRGSAAIQAAGGNQPGFWLAEPLNGERRR